MVASWPAEPQDKAPSPLHFCSQTPAHTGLGILFHRQCLSGLPFKLLYDTVLQVIHGALNISNPPGGSNPAAEPTCVER